MTLFTAASPIIGPATGTLADAERHAAKVNDPAALEYVREVFRLAPLLPRPLDAALAVAQSSHETTEGGKPWHSQAFRVNKNPAGIGYTDGGLQNVVPYKDGVEAARAHLVHLWVYAVGPDLPPQLEPYRHLDGRIANVVAAGYAGNATTLGYLTGRWATDSQYAAGVIRHHTAIFTSPITDQAPPPAPSPTGAVVFGRAKRPPMLEAIVKKNWDGAGFTRVPPRKPVGVCDHITDGNASIEFYVTFFGAGGERHNDALVDFVIDKSGRIGMLNDPFGTREPWANGGSDGLEGDGPLFVRTLGVAAINSRLPSKEHIGVSPNRMTDAQMEASADINAWLFDYAKVPYDQYPYNPNVKCVTHLQHWEFATKPCPGAGIRAQTDAVQDLTRGKLRAAQTGGRPDPIPPVEPPAPDHDRLPTGMDLDLARQMFGTGMKHDADGVKTGFGFNLTGAIGNAWLARAAKVKAYPEAEGWYQFADAAGNVREVVTFMNGWTLWRANEREGWRWM